MIRKRCGLRLGQREPNHSLYEELNEVTDLCDSVPLRRIAKPEDVARTMAFLASHRAAGHISGQCLSVDSDMEGRLVWKETDEPKKTTADIKELSIASSIPPALTKPKRNKIRIAVSIDLDAVSGWLGTGSWLLTPTPPRLYCMLIFPLRTLQGNIQITF